MDAPGHPSGTGTVPGTGRLRHPGLVGATPAPRVAPLHPTAPAADFDLDGPPMIRYPVTRAYPPGCGVSSTRQGSDSSTKDTPLSFYPPTTFEHNSPPPRQERCRCPGSPAWSSLGSPTTSPSAAIAGT